VTGQLTSILVGAKATVSMQPVNDPANAGVDWTVTCGGSPVNGSITGGVCGTFSPAHTGDGAPTVFTAPASIPIGNTVTITGDVTSDPSASSTVTLTIDAPPIAVSFAPGSTLPATLQANATANIAALVVNDSSASGVAWSATCGSTVSDACGSFSPATTNSSSSTVYTAPASVPPGGASGAGTVTVTAASVADKTKSVSAVVTILPGLQPLAITVSPATATLGAGRSETADLIATVSNDSTNAGVAWAIACSNPLGNCGSLSLTHTASGAVNVYQAPTSASDTNSVTITATAAATEASASVQTATATIAIDATPSISVTVTAPGSLAELATGTLKAAVSHDTTNSGVTWAVTCGTSGACGSISNQTGSNGTYAATYTAPASVPAGGLVTFSATPNASTRASNPLPGNPGLATSTITALPPAVAFQQFPPASLITTAQTTVSAVVTNDPTNAGVTWSVTCGVTSAGGCGYVFPSQTASGAATTYTAPPVAPAGSVTIVATSTANSATSATSSLSITQNTALSIGFVPFAPSQVEANSTVNLRAAVANDSTDSGVDWQLCAGCGFFTITPAIPAIPATAKTPYVPAVPAVIATSVTAWPNGLPIPYTAPTVAPAGGKATVTATSHKDGVTAVSASIAITQSPTAPALNGTVLAGSQPVVGSQVALYAAGSSGYGSGSTLLSASGQSPFATTGANGQFALPAGSTCPSATSEVYLVAIGGSVGKNPANGNLAFMAALGPCGALSSSALVVNEVTTVASAWALAPFAANPLTTGLISYQNIGVSSTNSTGLANAFASVNNLVNLSTGSALYSVPTGNATVPYPEINAFADMLDACAITSGGSAGDGSACGTLFSAANPYASQTGTIYTGIPTDTLQAAFEITQNPTTIGPVTTIAIGPSEQSQGLFSLVSTTSPFQPVLTGAPADLSLSLNYTSGGGISASSGVSGLAIDASGNLWITNSSTNIVSELNNLGAAVSTGGYTVTASKTTDALVAPGPIAIDASGNAWICGQNGLTELNFLGTEYAQYGGGGLTSSGCLGLAIAGSGDVWATNANSIAKFDDLGDPLSPATGYTLPISPTNTTPATILPPIAIDTSENVWLGVNDNQQLYLGELTSAGGVNELNFNPVVPPPSNILNFLNVPATPPADQTQAAVDSSGNLWIPGSASATSSGVSGGDLFKVPAYGGVGTTDLPSAPLAYSSGATQFPIASPRGLAIDGAGVVWTGNAGGTEPQTPPNLTAFNPSLSEDYFEFASPSLTNRPLSVSVDGSGNLWLLLDNGTVAEYIGIGTPAVTPLSLALKNKKLGAKP